jgi:hypothetical protein
LCGARGWPARAKAAPSVARVWAIVIGAGLALLVALVSRGSPSRFALAFRSWWMLGLAAVFLVALALVDLPDDRVDTIGFGALMLAYALILAFCLLNLKVRGMTIVTIGVAMNVLVIGLNRGLPVDGNLGGPEGETVLLSFLGENVPLPEPFDQMVTFGDLVIAVGIVDAAYHASRRPIQRRRPASRTPARASAVNR